MAVSPRPDRAPTRATSLVTALHCEGCTRAIRDRLEREPGVVSVTGDVDERRVAVEYEAARTDPEALRREIEEAGFDARLLSSPRREPPVGERQAGRPRALRYALLTLGVAVLAIAGYAGYEFYPRFDLPRVQGAALFLLAAAAGIASFFSPCAFPLLATLLARETGIDADRGTRRGRLTQGLTFAAALSAGSAVFVLLAGAGIALGGGALFAGVTFESPAGMTIRAIVGVLLVGLGLVQLGVLPNPLHVVDGVARPLLAFQARQRRRRPVVAFGVFGFGYLLAGFGGTGPILAGLAGHAFIQGGVAAALGAFVVAAATIVLMFTLSFSVATAQERLVAALKAHVTEVKRWGAVVLISVGVWLISLTVFAGFFARLFPV